MPILEHMPVLGHPLTCESSVRHATDGLGGSGHNVGNIDDVEKEGVCIQRHLLLSTVKTTWVEALDIVVLISSQIDYCNSLLNNTAKMTTSIYNNTSKRIKEYTAV